MSTCCSTGKARVYWIVPTKVGLKYRLKGEKAWKTILADEPLTSNCVIKNNAITNYLVAGNVYVSFGNSSYNQGFSKIILGPILNFTSSGDGTTQGASLLAITQNGAIPIHSTTSSYYLLTANYQYTVTRLDGQPDKKQFTVTGTETGTKYVDIEVDECPAVQTIPCKFDPAKEQHIDVEMIPYTELPVNLPNYPLFQDCIEISVGNLVVIEKVTTRNYGPKADDDPLVRETRKIIRSLESPKGCPPPKVRVECCPKGICGEDKKCPKGTTCELICNGLKCCYRNGKLIRSIKL